jgi:DNA (cytosine-5)-methyltransferase 1
MAVTGVLGGRVAWHCEFDPRPASVLAHRYPGVPNLGDITAVDWATVEPVDIICGGFPCQDISNAGQRAGIEGERSGLWSRMVDAISVVRPRIVVIENVAALAVRGLDRVLADLARLGFDAEWTSVRASDVGAPHRRERLFIVAHAGSAGLEGSRAGRHGAELPEPVGDRRSAADTAVNGSSRQHARTGRTAACRGGERNPGRDDRLCAVADTDRDPVRQQPVGEFGCRGAAVARHAGAVDWGQYGPAIRRWESVLGRPAPAPWQISERTGSRQLSARFTEWLMGLPDGWVTDVPGMTRNAALHILGNGVVPAQAAYALRLLLARMDEAAA